MITPDQARDKIDSGSAFEARIDAAIEECCRCDRWPCTVSLPMGRKIVEQVVKRYRSKGWRVTIVDDPRDGDFVQLERP